MKQSEAESRQYKLCKTCGLTLSLDSFYSHRTHKDGYKNTCKSCEGIRKSYLRKCNINGYKDMANERLKKHRKTPRGAMRQRYQAAQKRAKDLALPFSISVDFLMDLYNKQDGKCAISGRPLIFIGDFWDVLSIDRIIPELGYIVDNTQLVVNRVNMMKNNMSLTELYNLCKDIVEKGSETISKESTPKPVEAPNNSSELMI